MFRVLTNFNYLRLFLNSSLNYVSGLLVFFFLINDYIFLFFEFANLVILNGSYFFDDLLYQYSYFNSQIPFLFFEKLRGFSCFYVLLFSFIHFFQLEYNKYAHTIIYIHVFFSYRVFLFNLAIIYQNFDSDSLFSWYTFLE